MEPQGKLHRCATIDCTNLVEGTRKKYCDECAKQRDADSRKRSLAQFRKTEKARKYVKKIQQDLKGSAIGNLNTRRRPEVKHDIGAQNSMIVDLVRTVVEIPQQFDEISMRDPRCRNMGWLMGADI